MLARCFVLLFGFGEYCYCLHWCASFGPSRLSEHKVETSNPSRLGALLSGCYKLLWRSFGDISPTISIWHADECRQRNMIDSASLMLVILMERSPSFPSTLLRCCCWADKAAQILVYNPCRSCRECVLTSLHDALRAKKAPHQANMRVASYSCPCLFASQQ